MTCTLIVGRNPAHLQTIIEALYPFREFISKAPSFYRTNCGGSRIDFCTYGAGITGQRYDKVVVFDMPYLLMTYGDVAYNWLRNSVQTTLRPGGEITYL